jgi:hypothetical protein
MHKKHFLVNHCACERFGAGKTYSTIFVIVFTLELPIFTLNDKLLASFAGHWMMLGAVVFALILVADLI